LIKLIHLIDSLNGFIKLIHLIDSLN